MTLTKGFRQLLDEAHSVVTSLPAAEAMALHTGSGVLFVDVRDVRELQREGLIPSAFHAPRGLLEFWVDPDSPYYRSVFAQDRRFVLYCASGWRSVLACKALIEMGINNVCHIQDGFFAWRDAGGAIATYVPTG